MPIECNPLWNLTRDELKILALADAIERKANAELKEFLKVNPEITEKLRIEAPVLVAAAEGC